MYAVMLQSFFSTGIISCWYVINFGYISYIDSIKNKVMAAEIIVNEYAYLKCYINDTVSVFVQRKGSASDLL